MEATIENPNCKGGISHNYEGHDRGSYEYERGCTEVWKRVEGSLKDEGTEKGTEYCNDIRVGNKGMELKKMRMNKANGVVELACFGSICQQDKWIKQQEGLWVVERGPGSDSIGYIVGSAPGNVISSAGQNLGGVPSSGFVPNGSSNGNGKIGLVTPSCSTVEGVNNHKILGATVGLMNHIES
ncbi:hypothetical protein V6N13_074406 [Hibiscus sabdariffa]